MTSPAPRNTRYSVNVLSTSTADTSPSLLVVYDNQRYLFNTPEAMSRVCVQGKTGMRKIGNVFLGDLARSAGLPGFLLSTVEAGNNKVEVVGPEGTEHLVASYRFFTRREQLSLKVTVPPALESGSAEDSAKLPRPVHSDANLVVYAFPLQGPPTPSPLKRKRSSTSPSPPPREKSPPALTSLDYTEILPESTPSASSTPFDSSAPDFVPSRLRGANAATWRRMVISDMFRGKKFLALCPASDSSPKEVPPLDFAARYQATRLAPTPSYLHQALPLPDPSATTPTSICYLAVGPQLRGKFLPLVAKAKGVSMGEKFAKLTRGERVWVAEFKDEPVVAEVDAIDKTKKLTKAEAKKRQEEQRLREANVIDGVGDGHWVEPEDCLEPGQDGSAFLVLNLPSPAVLDALASAITPARLASIEHAKLQTVFYLIGPGVLHDERLAAFIATLPADVSHRFSSTDIPSTNNVTFGPAALLSLRLSYLSPSIFRLPTYSFLPPAPLAVATSDATTDADVPPTPLPNLDLALLPASFPPTSYLLRATDRLERAQTPQPPHFASTYRSFDFTVPSATSELEASRLKADHVTEATKSRSAEIWSAYRPAADAAREAVDAEAAIRSPATFPGAGLRVTPLGTGSAIPSKYRNVSSTLLHLPDDGGYVLLDAGEGTWGQIARRFGEGESDGESAEKVLRGIKLVFVSHLHQDHHAGLATILRERSLLSPPPSTPLTIVCPPGARMYLTEQQALFDLGLDAASRGGPGAVNFVDTFAVEPGKTFNQDDRRRDVMEAMYKLLDLKSVVAVPVLHRCRCWGVVIEHNSGWKAVFSGDTMPCDALVVAGKGATLLIHEATIEDELPDVARAKGHSTFGQAIDIARRMEAQFCLLTHFSARYPKLPPLLHDAVDGPQVAMAFDLATLRLDEFWKMERFRPTMDILFGDEEGDADSVAGDSVLDMPMNAPVEQMKKGKKGSE